jgi:hypothetical protein
MMVNTTHYHAPLTRASSSWPGPRTDTTHNKNWTIQLLCIHLHVAYKDPYTVLAQRSQRPNGPTKTSEKITLVSMTHVRILHIRRKKLDLSLWRLDSILVGSCVIVCLFVALFMIVWQDHHEIDS